MRAYLATNMMGCFAFDSEGRIVEKKLFPKKPETIAGKLAALSQGMLPEEREIIRSLIVQGYKEIVTDRKLQAKGIEVVVQEDNKGRHILQEEFRSLALSLKWVSSQAELNELLSKVQLLGTKEKLREGRRDRIVMRVAGAADEMEKVLNNFSERLREWYGLHFPELSPAVQSHEKFAGLVAEFGDRMRVKGFEELAGESAGMELPAQDIRELQMFAGMLKGMYERKKGLEIYLETACREVMPNTSAVAGEALAARLLSAAGGLEKLSRMPSSTIQILGAEKALFRHLKGEGKAPKYGLLFAHPLVQQAEAGKRGKTARLIAAKIFLASKKDFFSSGDSGAALRKELEEEVKSAGQSPQDAGDE